MAEFFNVSPQLIGLLAQSVQSPEYKPVAPFLIDMFKRQREEEKEQQELMMKKADLDLRRKTLARGIYESDRNFKLNEDKFGYQQEQDIISNQLRQEAAANAKSYLAVAQEQLILSQESNRRTEEELDRTRKGESAVKSAFGSIPVGMKGEDAARAAVDSLLNAPNFEDIPAEIVADTFNKWLDYTKPADKEEHKPGTELVRLIVATKTRNEQEMSKLIPEVFGSADAVESIQYMPSEDASTAGVVVKYKDGKVEELTMFDAAALAGNAGSSLMNAFSASTKFRTAQEQAANNRINALIVEQTKAFINSQERMGEAFNQPLTVDEQLLASQLFKQHYPTELRKSIDEESARLLSYSAFQYAKARGLSPHNARSWVETYPQALKQFSDYYSNIRQGTFWNAPELPLEVTPPASGMDLPPPFSIDPKSGKVTSNVITENNQDIFRSQLTAAISDITTALKQEGKDIAILRDDIATNIIEDRLRQHYPELYKKYKETK